MKFVQIRYFVAIADHGFLPRAALVLHVAQPALTQQLRQLEEELGAQLLLPLRARRPRHRCRQDFL
jgi:LysR family nitrogen assimilation transcriptional regulator